MLELFGAGFAAIFSSPVNILLIFMGVVAGIIFGALPGLTTVAALSMFLPITYGMDLGISLALLTGIYIGGTSGGLVSAVLLNIPGTPSSIATCFDGRPLALKGKAGKALGVGIFCSFIGTMVSIAAMVFISPILASLTIKFGPWENFAVTVFALALISSLVGKSLIKGLISALLGMMIATIGFAPIDAVKRYTFGSIELTSGFTLLPVLVGLYAISEVIASSAGNEGKNTTIITDFKIRGLGFSLAEMKAQTGNLIRSCFIGTGIGILPGIGGSTANLVAYSVAKNSSKYPEKFGTGIIDGVVASETANNATIGGAMIPLLTLGIPGDGSTALLLGGFMLHGITPGPLLFQNQGPAVYTIFAAMILSSFIMMCVMYGGMKGFVQILKIPSYILLPVIVVLCIIGAYATNFRTFDIWGLVLFGVIGLLMQKFGMPIPPLILGFILGEPFETNLRRGLQYSNGNIFDILNHPIAVFFFVMLALFFGLTGIQKKLREKKA
ncbi:MAG: tripartite tricarboxylate transporter permease [Spirochaetaceae bacterium]|jgi:putative tricarboxylic transport membrane protein|nr:tripartite tricarboxylate transporter permease [Spirochaetaceae bacterium]